MIGRSDAATKGKQIKNNKNDHVWRSNYNLTVYLLLSYIFFFISDHHKTTLTAGHLEFLIGTKFPQQTFQPTFNGINVEMSQKSVIHFPYSPQYDKKKCNSVYLGLI